MIENEITVKGIILSVYSQGEYGKRISLLSDKFGKITVFAQGAARQKSKIIGACRPFVCASFTIVKGKGAWNLHGVEVMESFEAIPTHPEQAFNGAYFLEFASYFAGEGIAEADSKAMLNLLFVSLKALSGTDSGKGTELVRSIFELRMLRQEGLYTETPAEDPAECVRLWKHVLTSPLSSLYMENINDGILSPQGFTAAGEAFLYSVKHLKNTQVEHRFKSEELL